MPLNRAALTATDKLTTAEIPDLAEGEYIEIHHVRDFPHDVEAEMQAQRYLAPIPRVGEDEDQAASREPTLRRHDAIYWRAVIEYMIVRLHVQDEVGIWMDANPAHPAGTITDRDDVWKAWGPYLWAACQARFGSVAPAIPEGSVAANGEPLTFRDADRLQPAGDSPESPERPVEGGGGAVSAPEAGAEPQSA